MIRIISNKILRNDIFNNYIKKKNSLYNISEIYLQNIKAQKSFCAKRALAQKALNVIIDTGLYIPKLKIQIHHNLFQEQDNKIIQTCGLLIIV
jgi:hypothetical protein